MNLREAIEVFRTLPPTVRTPREAWTIISRIKNAIQKVESAVDEYTSDDWEGFIETLTAEDIRFLVSIFHRYAANAMETATAKVLCSGQSSKPWTG